MPHERIKSLLTPWRAALYDYDEKAARGALGDIAGDALFHMCYPFGDFTSSDAFIDAVILPLARAWPDLERRDTILISGEHQDVAHGIGTAGYYLGTFLAPWLDIPPTGHVAHMRFHEFYRVEDGQIKEFQALWDIPEVMMQARAWPMVPSFGR